MATDETSNGSPSKLASPSKRPKKARTKAAAPAPWTFPKNTLEEAIAIPKAVEENNAGHPMAADLLVTAVGFKRSNDWRFLDLLKSANLYGLVSGTGSTATVSIDEIGRDVVAPGSPQDRQTALLRAFRNVEDFKKVDDFYGKKRIPEDEYFLNTLTRQFGIPRDRAAVFAEVFRANISFLRSFNIQTGAAVTALESEESAAATSGEAAVLSRTGKERRVREFLDTCFVMMPFITEYLRNTIKEPAKSIPHPFRLMAPASAGETDSD